jgi:hypothetical protein
MPPLTDLEPSPYPYPAPGPVELVADPLTEISLYPVEIPVREASGLGMMQAYNPYKIHSLPDAENPLRTDLYP